jgi:predicted DNA-binding transcriptional regulator AlpA
MADDTSGPRKMLTIDEVVSIVPVTKKTIYQMQRDGRFPRSHPLFPGAKGPQRRFWYADEIRAWQNKLEETY